MRTTGQTNTYQEFSILRRFPNDEPDCQDDQSLETESSFWQTYQL
jgi:hypothetical protein